MKIKVTAVHIKKGVRRNVESCPIALALHEKFNPWKVRVGGGYAIIITPDKRYRLPKIAREFLDKFDYGRKVKPVEFEMKKL